MAKISLIVLLISLIGYASLFIIEMLRIRKNGVQPVSRTKIILNWVLILSFLIGVTGSIYAKLIPHEDVQAIKKSAIKQTNKNVVVESDKSKKKSKKDISSKEKKANTDISSSVTSNESVQSTVTDTNTSREVISNNAGTQVSTTPVTGKSSVSAQSTYTSPASTNKTTDNNIQPGNSYTKQVDDGTEYYKVKGEPTIYSWKTSTTRTITEPASEENTQ